MDKKLNNRTIGCIIYTDKSLKEKEEFACEVKKNFP